MKAATRHGDRSLVEPADSDDSTYLRPAGQVLLRQLLDMEFIAAGSWEALTSAGRRELEALTEVPALMARLVAAGLLTDYQAGRLSAAHLGELLVGEYRVLDFLGSGGMSMIFKAEHRQLRRLAALKLMHNRDERDPDLLQRQLEEVRLLARLDHPSIVKVFESGMTAGAEAGVTIPYFAMEYVAGQDLEKHVQAHGRLSPAQACQLADRVAQALEILHDHQIVHRDLKPSNIMVTPANQIKLLDFGIARRFPDTLTEPGTILGTVQYLAPEQATDASTVDIRADLFSLGAVLFFCLTGQAPFSRAGNLLQEFERRRRQPPPRLRAVCPELPEELEQVVAGMMAMDRDARYAAPRNVRRALLPFLMGTSGPGPGVLPAGAAQAADTAPIPHSPRILIVDDDPGNRQMVQLGLSSIGLQSDQAEDGLAGWERLGEQSYDIALLDIDMPRLSGTKLLARLRAHPPSAHLKIIMFSGGMSGEDLSRLMAAGADDYLTKPLSLVQLQSRVKAALRLKASQERADVLTRELLGINHELEQHLHARDADLLHARNALVLALAELVANRDTETGAHLLRVQRYCRCLAEAAAALPAFAGQINESFAQLLECCAPLHDIGKVGIPDHILLKAGKLTPEERLIMETHPSIGAEVLRKVAQRHGFARAFFQIATDIARHHHERYDGSGYPDHLVGDSIPLCARLLTIADVYDALRSKRPYKPSLPHDSVVNMMVESSPGHFDPALLQAFQFCAPQFNRIYAEVRD